MSHTVKVDVQLKNKEAVRLAATMFKAEVIEGTHELFSSTETGLGIKIPGWRYPVVVKEDGTIAFDNYNGRWGDPKDLESFKNWYALSAVQLKANELGWTTSFNEESQKLTVFHPSGGTIEVEKEGVMEAFGFIGSSCNDATLPLEQALGNRLSETQKAEYQQAEVVQQQQEED